LSRVIICLLLLSTIGTFSITTCMTQPTQITVFDNYPAIQEAANNAIDGDAISARDSTHFAHTTGLDALLSANSALAWNKTYGGTESDFALAFVQTVDGGYALAGRTYSFGAGGSDFWLVKTDASGNHLWNRTYGGTSNDSAHALIQTADGGYALAGTTYSFGAGRSDFWLVKTDSAGNMMWNRTYGGIREDDPAHFVIQSVDGGYALAGRTYSFGPVGSNVWLIKTDASGNMLWNRIYGGPSLDGVFAFVQTVDGGYALAAHTYSFGAGNCDFWLVKTDSAGNMMWNETYGGTGDDWAYALVQTADGGYALIGETLSFGAGSSDVWLVRTDAFGNHLWNRTYGGTNVDGVFAFVQSVDGGYALAGHTYSFGAGNCDAWLVKTSADGSHEWNKTYGGTDEDFASRLVQMSDGSYVLAGSTSSFGAGSDDFWIVRTLRDATTITVPDDYSTIQEAINNAIHGDTIFVKAGTYYEHVVVNKTLSLIGENCTTTIVDGNWTGIVINVTRNDVIISGLTVRRSGNIYWENAGILLSNVENCNVSANILTENSFAGLELNYSQSCNVSGNKIYSNGGVGVTLVGGSLNDLSLNSFAENGWSALTLNDNANNNIISKNSMTSNNLAVTGHCINLYRSSNNTIIRNDIEDDDNGIRFEYWSKYNRAVENNIAQITAAGIAIETYSDNNAISGNTITGGRFGVSISNSRYTGICDNTIAQTYGSDIEAGVYLQSAGYTKIYENEITDNWRSILIYASSPYVSVYENNITNNEHGIAVARGGSNYCNVSENYVANNRAYGIALTGLGGASNYATVARNLIANNTLEGVGIGQGSSYNMVIQNNIIRNGYGIYIDLFGPSTQNKILNNNIINNTQQVRIAPGSVNTWDGSCASGGNYWGNYTGADVYRGQDQNLAGADGVGDTPHIIDLNNRDNYPLMTPWHWTPNDIAVESVTLPRNFVGRGYNIHVNVTVANQGVYTEGFNVTLHSNATAVETREVVLLSDDLTTLTFTLNTSGFAYGDYIIWVYAEPVPGEAYMADNTYVADTVRVTIPGDVDGDFFVNVTDATKIGLYWMQLAPPAPANADINDDGLVNIKDATIIGVNWLKHA